MVNFTPLNTAKKKKTHGFFNVFYVFLFLIMVLGIGFYLKGRVNTIQKRAFGGPPTLVVCSGSYSVCVPDNFGCYTYNGQDCKLYIGDCGTSGLAPCGEGNCETQACRNAHMSQCPSSYIIVSNCQWFCTNDSHCEYQAAECGANAPPECRSPTSPPQATKTPTPTPPILPSLTVTPPPPTETPTPSTVVILSPTLTPTPTPTPTNIPLTGTPTPTSTPNLTATPTPTTPPGQPTNTPGPTLTPIPVLCGTKDCDNKTNPCRSGYNCVQAHDGSNYCTSPDFTDACKANPSYDSCCTAPGVPTATPTEVLLAKASPTTITKLLKTSTLNPLVFIIPTLIAVIGLIL